MGDPKKQRKKYEAPRFPWRADVLGNELRLIGEYGLRNKKELWRYRLMLSRFRGIARSLSNMSQQQSEIREAQLLKRLKHLGILNKDANLDNVLDLNIEFILERRLQTLVYRQNLAKTIYQSRQLIIHRHISIDGKNVFSPSYLVPNEVEDKITYAKNSSINNPEHPIRESVKMNELAINEGESDE